MAKARASIMNRQLALEFAKSVTVSVDDSFFKVARAGKFSIFEVFARCCPWAIRSPNAGSPEGLSYQEFNKVLETSGFLKVRKSPPSRGADPSANFADPSNPDYTGAYAFGKRRWRNPEDEEDKVEMTETREILQNELCQRGCEIVSEEQYLAYILEAKVEGDRVATNNHSKTSDDSASERSYTASPEPFERKRSSECISEAHKRQRKDSYVDIAHAPEFQRLQSSESSFVAPSVVMEKPSVTEEAQNSIQAQHTLQEAFCNDFAGVWTDEMSQPQLAPDILFPPTPKHLPEGCWTLLDGRMVVESHRNNLNETLVPSQVPYVPAL